jgi:hypothetical protein
MSIDWDMIKQRPHFLIEKLSQYYDLDVYFIPAIKRWRLSKNKVPNLLKKLIAFRRIPFSNKIHFIDVCERKLNHSILRKIYNTHYDYTLVSSPTLLKYIDLDKLNTDEIIYDCMDDILEFPDIKKERYNEILEAEKTLINKANKIFSTSKHLLDILNKRGLHNKGFIINNAVKFDEISNPLPEVSGLKGEFFNMFYIGMVSSWFDFELMLKILEAHKNVKLSIIGPHDVNIPKHERLDYLGIVKHEELKEKAKTADAFIMPFKLNDLILSVDPIKVYEYISFMKPVFAVRYPETEKFSEFVYLYNTFEDLSNQLSEVKENPKILDLGRIKKFIEENSWDARAKQIYDILEGKT